MPQETVQSDAFAQYKFTTATDQLEAIYTKELNKALDRWKACLETVCHQLDSVTPSDWKEKVLYYDDEPYIRSRILVQTLITGLGNDYVPASTWLKALEVMEPIMLAFKERWKAEVQGFITTFESTRDVVACILAYNVMVNTFPKTSASDRRQSIKDLKKKLQHNFGKSYEMPANMSDRVPALIHDK